MTAHLLKDLKGLRVQVIHPPDAQGVALVEHLRRIGCSCETTWPLPQAVSATAVVVLVSIEQENRDKILRLFRPVEPSDPAVLAVVSFEDPSTLQVVLECGALAVIERPIRPFGLLTNLIIARSLWMERQSAAKRIRKLERKLAGNNRILRAKTILMETQGLSEPEAYESIRKQAMGKRVAMDDVATAIINAYELLTFKESRA
ncbi:ANTAR domain-containing response regulator [Labrys portucalensis]|jgi:AmiR/NasT family two-component response regulator|uniref:ANTAR domain-containing protein n=1 Tax=Labrys neptuniae TaxID=376174 RepID=A0ABV3PTI5_9HYPH|nr:MULTISPECIES: ANTAR domain-containing protein [Labrys]MBP0583454.1 ANTAR domain-containing protein [Labrys sp. LIt4]MDT3379752.1 ANTAR domain-containing protein [Labrys neptuniae]MDZ5453464.1 ANTAR domain-containing protein [Labrys sp. ZIDIC5]OCC03600.1 antitermination regulator [Labrys sp. WJW]